MLRGNSGLETMSPDSRVWIYQASRALNENEVQQAQVIIKDFVENWKAHGNELMAGFNIQKNQFIVIALDESFASASGCSIDSCVRAIKELGGMHSVDYLDRSLTAVANEDGSVSLYAFNQLKGLVENGTIKPDSLIYDNTVQKLSDLDSKWLVPAGESWMKRYFK